MANLIKWYLNRRKAKHFAKDMECIIHSIHPDAKFKINATVDKENLSSATFNIDTMDDKASACFILIQEALQLKENNA